MFPGKTEQYKESIRINADGFCFTLPDGSRRAVIRAPFTTIPYSADFELKEDEREALFSMVFPSVKDVTILTEHVQEFGITILSGIKKEIEARLASDFEGAVVMSHIHHILTESFEWKGRLITAIRQDDGIDVIATDNNRILFLNTLRTSQPYEAVYYIIKVWKESGFRSGDACIRLAGLKDTDDGLLRNLRLMTGENSVCVL